VGCRVDQLLVVAHLGEVRRELAILVQFVI